MKKIELYRTFSLCFLVLLGPLASCQSYRTAEEITQTIIKKTGAAKVPHTVDVIIEGNPETPVTGIITCMFATMGVLQEAVEKDCNLIITHEPTYYNGLDRKESFKDDPVFLEKQQFIQDHKLVVWRFHDYIHRLKPDGIVTGMARKFGWGKNQDTENPKKFVFPEMTLNALLKDMKSTFPDNGFYVVGEPEMKLSTVMFIAGASGTQAHLKQLRKPEVDVVVAGEVPQWETYEYVRDAVDQGRKKAIVFIGHINSEAAGMQYCADWLGEFITDIPIHYVDCGSSYWTY